MKTIKAVKTLLPIGIFLGAFLIRSLLIMWLWNFVIPDVSSFTRVSFFQAAGIGLLVSLLSGKQYKIGKQKQ